MTIFNTIALPNLSGNHPSRRKQGLVFSSSLIGSLLLLSSTCFGHLGEIHPDGNHDYYPDFGVSALADEIYIRPVLNVHGARDLVQLPDGSDRFFAVRSTNFIKVSKPDWTNEVFFGRVGAEDVSDTEGAVSVELHPGFATPEDPGFGKMYTVTIEKDPAVEPDFESKNSTTLFHSVVTEWTIDDLTKNRFEGTQREVMRFDEGSKFHNVNDLAFGPDGMLYLAVGEDTFGSQASDLSSVYGKVLRIDPLGTNGINGAYGVPSDNPYVSDESAAPEVYAYGLRNPWRINFDRETGALYAADIGWNSAEEINLIEPTMNYGWPRKEGTLLTAAEATLDEPHPISGLTVAEAEGYVEPLFVLDQTDTNSILGGVLYRGERFPELVGKYIFGSWNNGNVFVGDPETGEVELLMEKGAVREMMNEETYVSVNEDADGEIYLVGGWEIRALFRHPDFNDSGVLDGEDGDLICSNFGSDSPVYDLNGDLRVDNDDIEVLLEMANAIAGDFDLNGKVEFADFLTFSRNFGSDNPHWSSGDINCDQQISFEDFLVFSDNFGDVRSEPAPTPEPSGWLLLCTGLAGFARRRYRRRTLTLAGPRGKE